MIDKRQHPRVAKNVPVKIRCEEFDVVTETINLSCRGAYCRINKYIEPMTKLKIHLLLPFKKSDKVITRKVSCQGIIVRSEAVASKKEFNVAIFFNDINQRDVDLLSDYVDSVLTP